MLFTSPQETFTRAAFGAATCVKSTAGPATNVHSASEPIRNEGAQTQYCYQDCQIEQEILHPVALVACLAAGACCWNRA